MKLRATQAWQPREGGRRRIRLFEAYCNMLGRVRGTKSKDAGKYWKCVSEFGNWEHFRAWSLANGYGKGRELDRKDSLGPYSPANCQWLTRAQHKAKTHPVGCPCGFCARTIKRPAVRPDSDVPF